MSELYETNSKLRAKWLATLTDSQFLGYVAMLVDSTDDKLMHYIAQRIDMIALRLSAEEAKENHA